MGALSKPLVIAAFGARGTGKTAWMIQQVKGDRRLVVWDYKHDETLDGIGELHTDLGSLIRAMGSTAFRLHYRVDHDKDLERQFELFCRACFTAGRLRMFVAELPEVTRAGRAPPAWRKCVNVGRKYEGTKWLSIITEAQRWAEVDRSLTGNADVIHTGRLGNLADCKQLASMWGCQAGELARLPDLHWIERHANRPDLVRGVLSFRTPAKKVEPKKRGS